MKLSNLPAAAGELIAGCQVWEQFGMVLPPPRQAVMLAQHQAAALPDTGRIDFGGGVLKKLADAFCGSPYIQPADWANTLAELTTIFYALKNETRDLVGNDALIAAMAARFHTVGGSLEALASTEPIRFLRNAAERNDGHAF